MVKPKAPRADCGACQGTGVYESGAVCGTCGGSGEKKPVAPAKAKPVDSKAPRFYRGAKLRNT